MPTDSYSLLPSIDKEKLTQLIDAFEAAIKRRIDKSLASRLRQEVLGPETPSLNDSETGKVVQNRKPAYWDGMAVAQKISKALLV
jgi:hypothetical protein